MYQFKGLDDTIVAISTPVGQGGIAIVRLSGDDTFKIVDKLFKTKANTKPSKLETHTVNYGWVISDGDNVDEALLTVMRAPRSYTKQDVVEISCHGGIVSAKAIVSLACEYGARLAEPGEFTKRAFLNGRIDLTQAEAVLDIIQSKTDKFLQVSTNQLQGELSKELETIRTNLLSTYVEIEAIVNFPEDEIDVKNIEKITKDIGESKSRVDKLLETSDHGRILKEGIKIVLCGKPNVGKSSLLNVLLKTDRAIVSDIAGTTRDTIEETAQIKGIPFQLVDTAGVLEPRDLIEKEAIKRSHMYMQAADLVLLIVDSSTALDEQDQKLIELVKDQNAFVILNKTDLKSAANEKELASFLPEKQILKVSATSKKGVDKLEDAIVENVWHENQVDSHGVMVSNLRHINSLREAQQTLANALTELNDKLSLEFISEEIKQAVNHLDAITGRNIDEDLLNTIFSQFCIGK